MTKRPLSVHRDVVGRDLPTALAHYREIDPALAGRLVTAFLTAIEHVQAHPEANREYVAGYRRVVLTPFPYLLAYAVDEDSVLIAALLHMKRNPETNRRLIDRRT